MPCPPFRWGISLKTDPLFFFIMAFTSAEILAVKAKAQEIAARGVTYVQVGDRQHRFESVKALMEFAQWMESENASDTHGGMLDIIFMEPS